MRGVTATHNRTADIHHASQFLPSRSSIPPPRTIAIVCQQLLIDDNREAAVLMPVFPSSRCFCRSSFSLRSVLHCSCQCFFSPRKCRHFARISPPDMMSSLANSDRQFTSILAYSSMTECTDLLWNVGGEPRRPAGQRISRLFENSKKQDIIFFSCYSWRYCELRGYLSPQRALEIGGAVIGEQFLAMVPSQALGHTSGHRRMLRQPVDIVIPRWPFPE